MVHGWAAASSASAHTFIATLDDEVRVDGADGHHLQRVRRITRGEHMTAADGEGAWREYVVEDVSAGVLTLHAAGDMHVEPHLEPGLAVAFALTKGEQPEAVVRGLTELGVDRILPVVTARSQVRWRGDRARTEHERLERVAREASCQSRRARLPEIAPVGELADLTHHPGLVVAARSDRAGSPALPDLLSGDPDGGEWLLVVGPEGGLTPEESGALRGRSLAVGPYVLRAGTAAVAAAAAISTIRRSSGARESGHGQ